MYCYHIIVQKRCQGIKSPSEQMYKASAGQLKKESLCVICGFSGERNKKIKTHCDRFGWLKWTAAWLNRDKRASCLFSFNVILFFWSTPFCFEKSEKRENAVRKKTTQTYYVRLKEISPRYIKITYRLPWANHIYPYRHAFIQYVECWVFNVHRVRT